MDFLPVFLRVRGQPCLVVGGGEVALRKVHSLMRAGAKVTVVSPDLVEGLLALAVEGRIAHLEKRFEVADLEASVLVVSATNRPEVNQEVYAAAQLRRLPVNVVDCPELCSFIFPAIIDRSPLVIAVSSGGASPVLARTVRAQLELLFPKAYGQLAAFAEAQRAITKSRIDDPSKRRRFWERVLSGPLRDQVLTGQIEEAARRFESELNLETQEAKIASGFVSLVGAGPGDSELLTLKAFRVLQEADTIVFDRLVSNDILELARLDATRIDVGKESSHHTLPQDEITALLVRLAKEGQKVVRLKGGDPFIFGRGGEEIEGLITHGVDFQVIPGITAASGCATYAGIPLTHRDHAQSVAFITGHSSDQEMNAVAWRMQWKRFAQSRQTLVIYMGVKNLFRIRDELLSHDADPSLPVAIIERGTTPQQKTYVGTLENLPDMQVKSPAIIIIGGVVGLKYRS
ncbi:MAG: uroporphyrinogen-III C-methyltransferase [Pseudomonadota bacterium]|jgi:uroporphyrin-III C-methyltransferase/precorrin-2 dehydrogenase/sirohydrochlorin ferrochelatase